MRILQLNCGTCCPVGGRLFDGRSHGPLAELVCHCLLIETDAGLVLVDTGFGTRDVDHPHRRLSDFFLKLNNPQLRIEETAIAQVRHLGFDPADVRHIVVSHLDFDHAGGIEDFPNAVVHLTAREKEVADARSGGCSSVANAIRRSSGTTSRAGSSIRSAARHGSGSTLSAILSGCR
jgi:glyoxylase-like metal-dependent hydrolase (beta-lactamase superfamily II)